MVAWSTVASLELPIPECAWPCTGMADRCDAGGCPKALGWWWPAAWAAPWGARGCPKALGWQWLAAWAAPQGALTPGQPVPQWTLPLRLVPTCPPLCRWLGSLSPWPALAWLAPCQWCPQSGPVWRPLLDCAWSRVRTASVTDAGMGHGEHPAALSSRLASRAVVSTA